MEDKFVWYIGCSIAILIFLWWYCAKLYGRAEQFDKDVDVLKECVKYQQERADHWMTQCVDERKEHAALVERVSYLKARLSDYESNSEDTNFIHYRGETYRITDVVIEDHPGQAKTCSVDAHLVDKEV